MPQTPPLFITAHRLRDILQRDAWCCAMSGSIL
jgi:hypothetical protein